MGKNKKSNTYSRRKFVGTTLAATAGFTIIPSCAVSGLGYKAPSDKLNIAGIGVGGMGFRNLKEMETENIVGLCDVDWKYSDRVFKNYPKAKVYKDFRKMYDEMGSSIDGVVLDCRSYACYSIGSGHGNGETCVPAKAIDPYSL